MSFTSLLLFVLQVALAIEYLHSKSICHLDIKPENVLVWSESLSAPVNVKLADYGISRTVTAGGLNNECGTPGYQAPEQILSRKSRGESFDLRVRDVGVNPREIDNGI